MSTQTPEADAAEVRRREWAEWLVLSFLTSGDFVHPSHMVETLAAALRSAEKDAARAMRGRCAALVEERVDCFLRESGQGALLDAIEALEV